MSVLVKVCRTLLLAGCFSLCLSSCQYPESNQTVTCEGFAHRHGKLTLDGVQLVDQNNEPLQLRGISSHGLQWYGNCVTESSLTHLVREWGINLFRAVVYLEASDGGYLANPSYFDQFVDNIVGWCRSLGIYVVIDFHVLTKGDPNSYLDSRGASTGVAIDFWSKYADLYKDEDHVIYEIANEPNNVLWSDVLAYHNSVIASIRKIDPNTVIIAGTTTWSQDIALAYSSPVDQPFNIMYSFHFYAASHSYLYDDVVNYMNKIPIFVSEWGITTADGGGGYDTTEARRFLDLFAGGNGPFLSWTMWSWSDKYEDSAVLEENSCSQSSWTNVKCQHHFIESYFRDEEFSNMRIACNSSDWMSDSGGSTTSFQEKNSWLFWLLGAVFLSCALCISWKYCCMTDTHDGKNAFSQVPGTPVKNSTQARDMFQPTENPYAKKSLQHDELTKKPNKNAQNRQKIPSRKSRSSSSRIPPHISFNATGSTYEKRRQAHIIRSSMNS